MKFHCLSLSPSLARSLTRSTAGVRDKLETRMTTLSAGANITREAARRRRLIADRLWAKRLLRCWMLRALSIPNYRRNKTSPPPLKVGAKANDIGAAEGRNRR